METPSEWAKRFNRQRVEEEAGSAKPEEETVDHRESVAEFPSEPFPCPACGQLLAPSCRVCVACKRPINPAEIALPQVVVLPTERAPNAGPRPEPVRYPWRIFFAVLGVSFFFALIFEALWGEQKAQMAMVGVQTLAGVWVFFDALRRRIPRPLRWGVGSMLLPVIIFPWYLARRKQLRSPVPFVEAEVGPVTRFLLFALLIVILVSLIFYIVQGPPASNAPAPPSKENKGAGSPKPRIASLHSGKEGGRLRRPGEGSRPMPGAASAQAETKAPSDAWQT